MLPRSALLGLALLLPPLAAADPLAPEVPAHLVDFALPEEAEMLLLPRGAVRWRLRTDLGQGFVETPLRDCPQLARALRRVHTERHRRGEGMKVVWAGNYDPEHPYYSWVATSVDETVVSEYPIVPVGSALFSLEHVSGKGAREIVRVVGLAADPGPDLVSGVAVEEPGRAREAWAPVDLLFFPDHGGEDEIRRILARILSPHYRLRTIPLEAPQGAVMDHGRVSPDRFAGPFGL